MVKDRHACHKLVSEKNKEGWSKCCMKHKIHVERKD